MRRIQFDSSMCLSRDWIFRKMGVGRAVPKETGRPPYDPRGSCTAVCVRISESDALESAVGKRSRAQCGADVADAQA